MQLWNNTCTQIGNLVEIDNLVAEYDGAHITTVMINVKLVLIAIKFIFSVDSFKHDYCSKGQLCYVCFRCTLCVLNEGKKIDLNLVL